MRSGGANQPGGRRAGETPRWVRILGIIAAVAAVLLLVAMLVTGNHGPGRHLQGEAVATPVTSPAAPIPGRWS